jgi:hypothetical protein
MSKNLPKAVRLALLRDGIAEFSLNAVDDEMTYEYEHAIEGIRNISDRIEDALAFLSFSSQGLRPEAPWLCQQGLLVGY